MGGEGGDIIRNSNGNYVCGYARDVGFKISVVAKLWVLRDGINMCINMNLVALDIELDAKLMVELLKKKLKTLLKKMRL